MSWRTCGLGILIANAVYLNLGLGNGVLRDGVGGGFALGGADVAWVDDSLMAMNRNPANLSLLDRPALTFDLTGLHADASFENAFNAHTDVGQDSGVFPDVALVYPIENTRYTLGLSVITEVARRGDWNFVDALGGVDGKTTYGKVPHRSEFISVRGALGMSAKVTDKLAIGGSVGLVYHRIGLDLPFIFQSQPVLVGWKTLLNLDTQGYGWNADIGFTYHYSDELIFGLAYRTKTTLRGMGNAHGNVRAQLDSLGQDEVEGRFRYDAETETALPQVLTGGLSWQFHERFRLALQVEWTDWSDAFDDLGVKLTDGSNTAINELTRASSLRDGVSIDWDDQLVYRAGLAIQVNESLGVQLGYSYGRNPVPSRWVTPLNGSIFEHVIAGGMTYQRDSWQINLGYQYRLPSRVRVGDSAYQAGEYSNSQLQVATHALNLSTTWEF